LAAEGAVLAAPPTAAGTCAKLTVAASVTRPMIKLEIFEDIQLTFFKELRCAGYRSADCIDYTAKDVILRSLNPLLGKTHKTPCKEQ
jgi:hypothetical protein